MGWNQVKNCIWQKCDYDIIAESWELSAHPDGQSVIADGPYKDMYFGEFIEKQVQLLLAGKVVLLIVFRFL